MWPELAERIEQFDWSVSGVALPRYWIAIEASFIAEMLGDLRASTRWAMIAEKAAPDAPARIVAWCRLAARFGRNGEKGAHEYFTLKACEEYEGIPKDARLHDQQSLPLAIAEELIHADSTSSASRLMDYYKDVIATSVVPRGGEGVRLEAEYASILGLLEDQGRNRGRALEAYQAAFETLRGTRLMRGAAIVAYRLFGLTGEKQYEDFIKDALRDASERYWVKARLAKSRTEARLTARQLEVVRLVAQGLSNKEIAAARGISPSRARNVVAELFALLGVRSRAELAALATARGLLRPE
jgi:DNA-binding CsgD family transcriptional regulator